MKAAPFDNDRLPHDFWAREKPAFEDLVDEGVRPSKTDGDDFPCGQEVGSRSSPLGTYRKGGYYSAVEYKYRHFLVLRQVQDAQGKWVDCPSCGNGNAATATHGYVYCAKIRNSQEPFVGELLSADEACEARAQPKPGPDPSPGG